MMDDFEELERWKAKRRSKREGNLKDSSGDGVLPSDSDTIPCRIDNQQQNSSSFSPRGNTGNIPSGHINSLESTVNRFERSGLDWLREGNESGDGNPGSYTTVTRTVGGGRAGLGFQVDETQLPDSSILGGGGGGLTSRRTVISSSSGAGGLGDHHSLSPSFTTRRTVISGGGGGDIIGFADADPDDSLQPTLTTRRTVISSSGGTGLEEGERNGGGGATSRVTSTTRRVIGGGGGIPSEFAEFDDFGGLTRRTEVYNSSSVTDGNRPLTTETVRNVLSSGRNLVEEEGGTIPTLRYRSEISQELNPARIERIQISSSSSSSNGGLRDVPENNHRTDNGRRFVTEERRTVTTTSPNQNHQPQQINQSTAGVAYTNQSTGSNNQSHSSSTGTAAQKGEKLNKASAEMLDYMRIVGMTANIDSLYEQPNLLSDWMKQVSTEILEQKPQFAFIHLQGIQSERQNPNTAFNVQELFEGFKKHSELTNYFESVLAFIDSDGQSEFTGLGSIYFVKDTIASEIWRYDDGSFKTVSEGQKLNRELANDPFVMKGRFPDNIHPNGMTNSSSGPDGFMTTKWSLFNKQFTFINVHLFSKKNKEANISKEKQTESSMIRTEQMHYLLGKMRKEDHLEARIWAGQFNSELDQTTLVNDMCQHNRASRTDLVDDTNQVVGQHYSTMDGKKFLTVSPTKFDMHSTHDWFFGFTNGQMAKKYNTEWNTKRLFNGQLKEPAIYYPPTCHYEYDRKEEKDAFSRKQCPSWSDRIMLNNTAWDMIKFNSFSSSGSYYGIVGQNVNLGAHKPVAFHATVALKHH